MKVLYEQTDFPVFQNKVYDTKEEAVNCPKGDIQLVEDAVSGLIFNAAFQPELMKYDNRYQNEQAVSNAFQNHLHRMADIIEAKLGRSDLVEVGCGKGYFLELLLQRKLNVTGFDPVYEGCNPNVRKEYFSPNIISKVDGLILRHVLEHIQDPVDFLYQLKEANGGSGKIYIEVPCFEWICSKRAWFDIFYEHVNYFRLSDFFNMFDVIHDYGKVFNEQYIYIIAELSSLKKPMISNVDRTALQVDFIGAIEKYQRKISASSVVWGGSSKGVIFTLLQGRLGHPISNVVDINPVKQSKYMPATGIKISSPNQALNYLKQGETIFVMNSNYLPEIKQITNNQYNYIGIDND